MEIFRAEGWGWPEYIIDLLVQLAFLAALIVVSTWLWPSTLAGTAISMIRLWDWLWAAASLVSWIMAAVVLYAVLVEFVMVLANGTQRNSYASSAE